jgi:hypothetical protein
MYRADETIGPGLVERVRETLGCPSQERRPVSLTTVCALVKVRPRDCRPRRRSASQRNMNPFCDDDSRGRSAMAGVLVTSDASRTTAAASPFTRFWFRVMLTSPSSERDVVERQRTRMLDGETLVGPSIVGNCSSETFGGPGSSARPATGCGYAVERGVVRDVAFDLADNLAYVAVQNGHRASAAIRPRAVCVAVPQPTVRRSSRAVRVRTR